MAVLNLNKFEGFPWQHFMDFISPDADRFFILNKILAEAAVEYKVLDMAGGRHFLIAPPPPEEKYLRRAPVILIAHYDRAENSSGANDNSAAVFLLVETAMKLKKGNVNNWIIIFTDREELKPGEGIQVQGAYALAAGLKLLKMDKSKIYSFDACGSGDTLIISTTLELILKNEKGAVKLREAIMELRNLALDTARYLGMKKVLLAPTPFSDDVGFFRAGLAAQTITVLPSDECIKLVSDLRKNQEFANVLILAESQKSIASFSIPETWRCLNSPSDSYLRLTPAHFRTVIRFAEALCRG